MNHLGGTGLWSEDDGFYYDQLHVDGQHIPLKVRSMVGVLPLIAVEVLDEEKFGHLEGFKRRMQWFLDNRTDVTRDIACMRTRHREGTARRLLAIPTRERLERMLRYVLDEREFLSPIRAAVGQPGRTASIRTSSTSWGCRTGWTTSPRRATPACSAATRTGVGRSGSPSISWCSRRWSATTTSTARTSRWNAPWARGSVLTLEEVAAELQSRLSRLFLADAARPPALPWERSPVRRGSPLEGPGAVLRILRRRQRARGRRESSDRVDGAGRAVPGGRHPTARAGHSAARGRRCRPRLAVSTP